MSQSNPAIDPFILGEINATVRGTAEDVKALRVEVGDLARRLANTEQDVQTIKADRSAMLKPYETFVHKVNNHMAVAEAWRNQMEGQLKGAGWMSKLAAGIGGSLLTVGIFIAGQMLKPAPGHSQTQTTSATQTQSR